MKVEMFLIDAGALELVIECAKCQRKVTVTGPEWNDDVRRCPGCSTAWIQTEAGDAAAHPLARILSGLRDLIQLDEPGRRSLPYVVRCGAAGVVR